MILIVHVPRLWRMWLERLPRMRMFESRSRNTYVVKTVSGSSVVPMPNARGVLAMQAEGWVFESQPR